LILIYMIASSAGDILNSEISKEIIDRNIHFRMGVGLGMIICLLMNVIGMRV